MVSLEVVKFCAAECRLQQSGEMSVYQMIAAWDMAQHWSFPTNSVVLNSSYLQSLGKIVEPDVNCNGFRRTNVMIGGDLIGWENIDHQISSLLRAWIAELAMTPEEFYQEFEAIHPFQDGNGRVGQILYNSLNGTMDHPTLAPEYIR